MKNVLRFCTAAILTCSALLPLTAGELSYFTDWPEGTSPKFIGTKATERFIAGLKPKPGAKGEMRYQRMVAWYGALTFAKVSGQPELTRALIEGAAPTLEEKSPLIPPPDHVDRTVFGALAAELAMQGGDARFREIAKRSADAQWEPSEEIVARGAGIKSGLSWPFNDEAKSNMQQGLSWQTRYWIDDMYMITMAQGQMYRLSGEKKYIERAAKEMVAYLDKLQQPNGLFYHAPDVPFYWGRGNGWMAAGMAELLSSLPQDNPDRERILAGYRKMMATLKDMQSESGMWRQLVDDPKSWAETSCTGMFVFAMVTGVKEGWLDAATYGPVARKGWIALAGYVHNNGDVCQVCIGTNKENSREYYLKREKVIGDLHGQAALLWSATALLRRAD
jgi:rhamnogalacturonyl hydrolase YesR